MTPAVTYTFTDGTTVDAGQFNTNYSDMTAALSDASHDINVSTLYAQSMSVADSTVATTAAVYGRLLAGSADATFGDLCSSTDSSVCITGQIFSDDGTWTLWPANAVGWTKLDSSTIMYRKTGRIVHVAFDLDGTVNNDTVAGSSSCNFVLPVNARSTGPAHTTIYAVDDGTNVMSSGYNALINPGALGPYSKAYLYPNWYVFSWSDSRGSNGHDPAATFYLSDATSDVVAGYYKATTVRPAGASADSTWSVVADSATPKLIASWVTDTPPGFAKMYGGYPSDAAPAQPIVYTSVKADATPNWDAGGSAYKSYLMYRYAYYRDGTEYQMWDGTMSDAPQYHGITSYGSWSDYPSTGLYGWTDKGTYTWEDNDRMVIKLYCYKGSTSDGTVSVFAADGSSSWHGPWGDPYAVRRHVKGSFLYESLE